jgi:hypothetical protein
MDSNAHIYSAYSFTSIILKFLLTTKISGMHLIILQVQQMDAKLAREKEELTTTQRELLSEGLRLEEARDGNGDFKFSREHSREEIAELLVALEEATQKGGGEQVDRLLSYPGHAEGRR